MKFQCECGNNIYDQTFPNPLGYRLVPDAITDVNGDCINADAVWLSSRVLRCDNCGRLWITWKDGDGKLQQYAPIDDEGRGGERAGARAEAPK